MAGWVDADGVRDNGCELFPEAGTIYVSTPANGGADVSGCGAWNSPCGTISGGISRAIAAARTRVRVSSGLFIENVTLVDGISVLGGHSSVSWVRDTSVYATAIRGTDAASSAGGANDRIVVAAVDITTATELSGFSIEGVAARAAGNSIGLYIRDSTNALVVQDNTVSAGAGGNGSDGTPGTPGAGGGAGATGVGPVRQACGGTRTLGGSGGVGTCGGLAVNGGAGGAGPTPSRPRALRRDPARAGPGRPRSAEAAASGATTSRARPPRAGARARSTRTRPRAASRRQGGRAPTVPAAPGRASTPGSTVAGQWRGATGAPGSAATAGGGGGGGGSPGRRGRRRLELLPLPADRRRRRLGRL